MSAATITFDTLVFANKLKEVGVPPKQAEMQAELLAGVLEDKLATKQDIQGAKQELDFKIDLRAAELKNDLIRWVLGISVAQAAIIISCLKFIH